MRVEELGNQMERIVLARLESDRLTVPAMPPVAAACIALTREPEFSTKRAVTLLEKDAILTARVINAASAAAFGSPVTSLAAAVNRLGTSKLRAVVFETAAAKLFVSSDRRIAAGSQQIWYHSLAVAMMARDLAAFTGSSEAAEVAYLAGLLHDVGKVVLGGLLLEAERHLGRTGQWLDGNDWMSLVAGRHRNIGVALTQKWGLPADVVAAVNPGDDYAAERTSPINYVRFANAVAKREGLAAGPFDGSDNDVLIMIGRSLLGIDDDLLGRVATGLSERVAAYAAV